MGNINTTMGIKSIKYGEVKDQYATPTKAVADVYQDSCTFVEKDPTITEHKSETSRKKIVIKRAEGFDLVFSIMDPTPDELKAFKGGSLGSDGNWIEPETDQQISMALEIEPAEGKVLCIPDAAIVAKINTTYSSTGITLLEVTATPQKAIHYANQKA